MKDKCAILPQAMFILIVANIIPGFLTFEQGQGPKATFVIWGVQHRSAASAPVDAYNHDGSHSAHAEVLDGVEAYCDA